MRDENAKVALTNVRDVDLAVEQIESRAQATWEHEMNNRLKLLGDLVGFITTRDFGVIEEQHQVLHCSHEVQNPIQRLIISLKSSPGSLLPLCCWSPESLQTLFPVHHHHLFVVETKVAFGQLD